MVNSKSYFGAYTDSAGTIPIKIENDFKTLSCEIDGVKFSGREFSDLAVDDRSKFTSEQLARFTFYPIQIYGSNEVELFLCNCSFSIKVPQTVIDIEKNTAIGVNLKIECFLGAVKQHPYVHLESEWYELSMTINGQIGYGRSQDIEGALLQVQHQLGNKYLFKNCFGCMYGDYSFCGSSAFGSMICYVGQKQQYKQVTNKDEYMDLDTSNCERVQEIYCCADFEIRKEGAGYRG